MHFATGHAFRRYAVKSELILKRLWAERGIHLPKPLTYSKCVLPQSMYFAVGPGPHLHEPDGPQVTIASAF